VRASASVLVAAALLAGCAPRAPATAEVRALDFAVATARFRIVHGPGDEAVARRVRRAVELAVPRVARWGVPAHPITVTIHPSQGALAAAVHRPGDDWPRGWARWETIELQSPRTWGFRGASDRDLEQLVAHELTHCVTYQLAGDRIGWMHREIPRWFAEGIASVTAGEGHRHGGMEALLEAYEERLGAPAAGSSSQADPFLDSDPRGRRESRAAYRAAHHAAELLVARHGEQGVREVLRLMGSGLRFPAAFERALGLTPAAFVADFRRHVVSRAWRR
jgi:hypothetical protein